MHRFIVVIILIAAFLPLGSTTYLNNPTLFHDTATGRVKVVPQRPSQSISVKWDRIAQDLIAELKVGPTIAAGTFAKLHTAVFETWAHFEGRSYCNLSNNCGSLQKASMSIAASKILSTTFPSKLSGLEQLLQNELNMLILHRASLRVAQAIADTTAEKVIDRYNREIVEIGEYPWRSSIEKWTPEHVPIDDITAPVQKFLTPSWGRRYTFAVPDGSFRRPEPPQPFLLVNGTVDLREATIYLDDGRTLSVNRSLVGSIINPLFIQQVERVINESYALTDRTKFIAEFWEAGPGTSFPPGMWMAFGEWVSSRDSHTEAQDVCMFFALSNALNDAGVLTWNAKKYYNYARPVRAVRNLADLGLIGNFDSDLNAYMINAYDLSLGISRSFSGLKFESYQKRTSGASPPFPEYTSGHSAFSAAAAEVLRRYTGSDRFGAHVTLPVGESRFESGRSPKTPVTLQWNTFSGAAKEGAASRVFGGIHFEEGEVRGLDLGQIAGKNAFLKAEKLCNEIKK